MTTRVRAPARKPRQPKHDLASFAEHERLSGPRLMVDVGLREPPDDPALAERAARCECDRPLPETDDLETRCMKCGRRRTVAFTS